MTLHRTTRADLHCHSTASEHSKLGVQRALGLPECATPPEEVLELADRRGMDFVTITDHDTIAGVEQIADDARVFISEELTAWFKGEPRAVHVLCLGITPDDHAWLQAHNHDVEACAGYLRDNGITCALAHPFYTVAEPLTAGHRRRLAQLFDVWEVRNGARARELNLPVAVYVETHGGTGVGGSDDHAGVDIGRTWTETPYAASPDEFLAHVRAGSARAGGDQGSAAKWAHAAMALAVRALGREGGDEAPDPRAVLAIAERVLLEGNLRAGSVGSGLEPDDARSLLRAWLDAVGLDLAPAELIAVLQAEGFSHADLFRRARREHERKLAAAVGRIVADPRPANLGALWEACVPAIPYAPAAAFLGREKRKFVERDGEPIRVGVVADGIGAMHGVTHTLNEIRERGVPGFEIEVVGTDANVDRRLAAVADVDIPFYAGLSVGVPSLPAVVEVLAEGSYDLVHVCAPGPAGIAAALIARGMEMPVLGSYHTELAAYTGLRVGDEQLEAIVRAAVGAFYGQCAHVLSPSPASDLALQQLGIEPRRIGRWDRGVDCERFARRPRERRARIDVLYAGRLAREKGVDLLADAFLRAHTRDPRLHLVLAGGGPEEDRLRARLGDHATFLGWLEGDDLAAAYTEADLFLFASRTDTFGQVLLEAMASGVPVIAVDEGGPRSIVRHGQTGLLCAPSAEDLARAVNALAGDPERRERLAAAALEYVRQRTWEASLARLATGYRMALGAAAEGVRRAA